MDWHFEERRQQHTRGRRDAMDIQRDEWSFGWRKELRENSRRNGLDVTGVVAVNTQPHCGLTVIDQL